MPIIILSISFFQKLWAWLDHWDSWLFLKINTAWTNSLLDSVYPWWREANTWIPLYLFLLIFGIMNFKKKVIPWLLFVAITLMLSDQISSTFIKNWVARPRPCREEALIGKARLLLDNCSGTFSFPSSHAANHFAFATFLFITLQPVFKKWNYLFFVWAATVAYGQVYVGIHYPLDVIVGGILGCGIGYLTGSLFIKKIGSLSLDTQ